MEKEEAIKVTGLVTKVLPNNMLRVDLKNGHKVLAYTCGKMKRFSIRILQGDTVDVELSPYDLARGRVVYRHK